MIAVDNSMPKTPWEPFMGDIPMHLDYFDGSMYDAVAAIAEKYPNAIAFDFMGKHTTYKTMMARIERTAMALRPWCAPGQQGHGLPSQCASGRLLPLCH